MDIRSPPMRMSVQRTTAPASRPRPVAISIFAGCGITQYRCVKSGLIFRAFPRTRSTSCSSRCRAVLGSLGPKLGPSFSQLHATCSRHGARVLPPASGGLPGRFPTFGVVLPLCPLLARKRSARDRPWMSVDYFWLLWAADDVAIGVSFVG